MVQHSAVAGMSKAYRATLIAAVTVAAAATAAFFVLRRAPQSAVEVGQPALDFTVPSFPSGQVRLHNHRGRVVLVNFWATWCPPCVEESPSLQKFAELMRTQGVEVLGISVDQDPAALQKFIDQSHLTFTIGRDPNQELAHRYGTFVFPETYIVDRDGRVAEKIIGPIDWQDPRIIAFVRNLANPSGAATP
jgi:cytochrome c biogenesis protein CcmG, thiol:disulfide interchange protein DsbE